MVKVTDLSLTYAEAPGLQYAYSGFHTLIQNVLTQYQAPPLYYVSVQLASALFPPVLAVRLPALVPGIGLIVLAYVFARLLAGTFAASVAAAVVALSPLAVWTSHIGGGYELGACLALLSSVLLLMALQHGAWWPVAYAISLSLALYADFTAALVIVAQGVLLLWLVLSARRDARAMRSSATEGAFSDIGGSRLRDCLGAYAAGWLFALPWLLFLPPQNPLLPRPQPGWSGIQWAIQAVAQSLGLNAAYAHLPATLPFVASVVIVAGYADAATLVVATAVLSPARRAALVPLCLLALAPVLVEAALAVAGVPIASPYSAAAILMPGIAVVGGIATELAYSYLARGAARAGPYQKTEEWKFAAPHRLRWPAWRAGLLAVLAVAIFVGGANATWLAVETGGSVGEHWDTIAAELASKVTLDDVVIYFPVNVAPVIEAYLPPDTAWLSQQQGLYPQSDAATQQHFARWIAGRAHVWIVYYSVPGAHLPTQDAWLAGQGYCRLLGNPSAAYGLLEYAPCDT